MKMEIDRKTKEQAELPDYRVVRSNRKTIGLHIERDGSLSVHLPYLAPLSEAEKIVRSNLEWIEKSREKIRMREESAARNGEGKLSIEELRALGDRACRFFPERVRYYSKLMGVSCTGITIRCQRTRWGSCSTKGRLNFNCLLMLAPQEVADSVVVHELAHRKQMNHSEAFYAEILKVMPDYKERQRWLKEHGEELMARLPDA